jgi:hypothetical protein
MLDACTAAGYEAPAPTSSASCCQRAWASRIASSRVLTVEVHVRARSERAHVHEEQGQRPRDRCHPGQGRHVEPRRPEQPFTGGLPSGFTVRPDSRRHAERRCERARRDNRNDPRRVALRASRRFTSKPGEQQDEPRHGRECHSSERGVLRPRRPKPRAGRPPRHTTHNDTRARTGARTAISPTRLPSVMVTARAGSRRLRPRQKGYCLNACLRSCGFFLLSSPCSPCSRSSFSSWSDAVPRGGSTVCRRSGVGCASHLAAVIPSSL